MSHDHPYCACGRGKLQSSRSLDSGPVYAEIMQRLETIRQSKIEAMRRIPPAFQECRELADEERVLRDRLARLAHTARLAHAARAARLANSD